MSTLKGEVSTLTDKLKRETERVNEVWRMSCEQVSAFDEAVTAKDAEIEDLKAKVALLEASRSDTIASPTQIPALESPRVATHGPSMSMSPSLPHSSREVPHVGLSSLDSS